MHATALGRHRGHVSRSGGGAGAEDPHARREAHGSRSCSARRRLGVWSSQPATGMPVPNAPGAYSVGRLRPAVQRNRVEEKHMSKGMDQKKEQKKKPAKSMKEKKAEKRDKKAAKPFMPT